MKKASVILMLLALLACLAGCSGKRYTEAEQTAARQKGEQMMQQWLDRTLTGAELLSVEPYILHNTGVAPYKLTELVSGTLRSEGREQNYWLDTSSGEVWFEQSGETIAALGELCGTCVAQALGLGSCQVTYALVKYDIGVLEQPDVLPAEFVLSGQAPEAFLRHPEGHPPLPVSVSCRVPDDFSLAGFTLADTRRVFDRLLDEYALSAGAFVENGNERVALNPAQLHYERDGFLDLPDFRVRATVYERWENVDSQTGTVRTDAAARGVSDLVVEHTANGWKTSFPNGFFTAAVYAYDGSEMLRHTYVLLKDPDAPNDYDKPLVWKQTDLGWALCFADRDGPCVLSDRHILAERRE